MIMMIMKMIMLVIMFFDDADCDIVADHDDNDVNYYEDDVNDYENDDYDDDYDVDYGDDDADGADDYANYDSTNDVDSYALF